VIQKIEIMPLVLARCPAFTPTWERHRLSWEGEEAGIYNDLAEFATFIVNCYAQGHIEPVVAAFALIEELLVGGNEEVRNAASIGFLAWIIHDLTGEKRKDALKGVMNTGFWRTQHSLSEHPRDDILLYTTAVVFLLPTPPHSS
jgi:hypothetical protein